MFEALFSKIAQVWQERNRPPETHSEKHLDEITPWEGQVMLQQFKDSGVLWCPDCGKGLMQTGPQGGEATMVRCPLCLCEFTIYRIYLPREVWGRRLTDRKHAVAA